MAIKTNYKFEKMERDRLKAEKKKRRMEEKRMNQSKKKKSNQASCFQQQSCFYHFKTHFRKKSVRCI